MMESIGKLYLKVLKAKNTLALDMNGFSDPYVLSSLICNIQTGFSNSDPIYKSEIITKTLNPVWKNEEYVFDVTQPSQSLYIEMWDEDKLTSDDFMGQVKIGLEDIVNSSYPKGSDIAIPMKSKKNKPSKKKRGELYLNYQFFSVKDLVSVLVNDKIIIKSVSKIIHNDEFAKSLVFILANHGDLIETIKEVITMEVESTENANVLFRTDSLATKLTVSTFRIIGYNYLEAVILPLVINIINQNQSHEVDTSKGVSQSESENNLKLLLGHCEVFLESIINSLPLVPPEMRVLLQHISQQVEKKFSQEKNANVKSVGGFFFLRFVNAAIFSPEALGFIKESPTIESRRTITLISKILQNISNQITFSNKEMYLEPSNTFIKSKFEPIAKFLTELSTIQTVNTNSDKFKSLFKSDQITLLKYSDIVFNSIQEKKQQVQFKIKTLIPDSHKILEELEKRCSLSTISISQESKKYNLKH